MRKTNENGFSVIEIIMAVVIVGLIGLVAYMAVQAAQNKNDDTKTSSSPSPSVASTANESDAASKHVKEFYKKYLNTMFGPDGKLTGDTYAVSNWVSDGYMTQAAADQQNGQHALDLPTCSQSPLYYNDYTFDKPVINGSTGKMELSGTYTGLDAKNTSDDQTIRIKLSLVKDNDTWKVDAFDCAAAL